MKEFLLLVDTMHRCDYQIAKITQVTENSILFKKI